jgi:hypothetical protein
VDDLEKKLDDVAAGERRAAARRASEVAYQTLNVASPVQRDQTTGHTAEPAHRPRGPPPTSETETDAMSVETFCERNGLGQATFYKHRSLMPRTFRVGARVLISREAAAHWRAERERATAAESEQA